MDPRLQRVIHDIRCGSHSGIPPCCIAWFIGPWTWMAGTRLRRAYWDAIPVNFQHVGCPLCIWRGNIVQVQDCDCGPDDWLTRLLLEFKPTRS